jgi:hypothetical protein
MPKIRIASTSWRGIVSRRGGMRVRALIIRCIAVAAGTRRDFQPEFNIKYWIGLVISCHRSGLRALGAGVPIGASGARQCWADFCCSSGTLAIFPRNRPEGYAPELRDVLPCKDRPQL